MWGQCQQTVVGAKNEIEIFEQEEDQQVDGQRRSQGQSLLARISEIVVNRSAGYVIDGRGKQYHRDERNTPVA